MHDQYTAFIHTASLSFDQYQIILFSDKARVW